MSVTTTQHYKGYTIEREIEPGDLGYDIVTAWTDGKWADGGDFNTVEEAKKWIDNQDVDTGFCPRREWGTR